MAAESTFLKMKKKKNYFRRLFFFRFFRKGFKEKIMSWSIVEESKSVSRRFFKRETELQLMDNKFNFEESHNSFGLTIVFFFCRFHFPFTEMLSSSSSFYACSLFLFYYSQYYKSILFIEILRTCIDLFLQLYYRGK